jgi:hypothetical protein
MQGKRPGDEAAVRLVFSRGAEAGPDCLGAEPRFYNALSEVVDLRREPGAAREILCLETSGTGGFPHAERARSRCFLHLGD